LLASGKSELQRPAAGDIRASIGDGNVRAKPVVIVSGFRVDDLAARAARLRKDNEYTTTVDSP
jgi:hypothetical protein